MSGRVRANLLVSRVFGVPAGVTDRSLNNTRNLVKIILHAPKTIGRKNCLLHYSLTVTSCQKAT